MDYSGSYHSVDVPAAHPIYVCMTYVINVNNEAFFTIF